MERITVSDMLQLAREVNEVLAENEQLKIWQGKIGEVVICPAGDGVVPMGARGVIVDYELRHHCTTGNYEAIGVKFVDLWHEVHWFAAYIPELDFEPDGRGVPTLMYQSIYAHQREQIDNFLATKSKLQNPPKSV